MLRFIAIFIFFIQSLLYGVDNPFSEYEAELLSIDGGTAQIEDSEHIVVGSSGIVTHSFDHETTSIIARVSVIKKDGKYATVKFEVFDMLEQAAFPLPGITPQKGDKVTLNYLYNRALIIAPNEAIYDEVTQHFDHIQWVHPDILAAYLAAEYRPNPGKNSFDLLCRKNTAGLIFFALDRRGFFADCQSLTVLKTLKSGPISSYQLPFYNRIGGIGTTFWKWSGRDIKDYNAHYARLLGL